MESQTSIQMVIKIVSTQRILELIHFRVLVDHQELDPGHAGKILQVFRNDRIAETGMMSAASVDPRRGCNLQVRARQP